MDLLGAARWARLGCEGLLNSEEGVLRGGPRSVTRMRSVELWMGDDNQRRGTVEYALQALA